MRLRACNCVGGSKWGATQLARTAPAAPAAPEAFSVTAASRKSLSLAWAPPRIDHGAAVTSYQVEVAPAARGRSAAVAWKAAYKGDALAYTVDDLRPGHAYSARVRALNSCGWGPWSAVISGTTAADVPSAPDAPTTSARTSTGVRLSWAPPLLDNGALVTGYELQMAAGGAQGAFSAVFSGAETSFKAAQLSPGMAYAFRVRAANAVGAGAWSAAALVTTSLAPPAAPTQVAAACAGDDPGAVVNRRGVLVSVWGRWGWRGRHHHHQRPSSPATSHPRPPPVARAGRGRRGRCHPRRLRLPAPL